ncbi:hypothetical protein V5F34_01310 [Xanthobacter autotrophicus]|uniref:hypothetical protein n=1 Tax=Xanthobacter autotrophicus TaxID=280 RepID=UPI0037288732
MAELAKTEFSRELGQVIAGEFRLFTLRRTAHEGKTAQRREQITQLEHQTRGLESQLNASATEITLIARELEAMQSLADKKLVTLERVIARERDAARLTGERGRLTATIAQSRTKANELQLALIQLNEDLPSEAPPGCASWPRRSPSCASARWRRTRPPASRSVRRRAASSTSWPCIRRVGGGRGRHPHADRARR